MTTLDLQAAAGAAASTTAPESLANDQGVANPADTTNQPSEGATDPATEHDRAVKKLTRRVDNVTRARYEAEARAQQAIERAERAERQLQERQSQQQPGGNMQTQEEQQRAAPRPEDIERHVEQRAAEVATVREAVAKANKVFDAGVKDFGDAFKDSVSVVQEEAGPLYQRNGMPTALGEAITDADNPAALLHHLGQNPEVAEELKGLSAAQLGRRIARIEASMASSTEAKPSGAPKPLTPVKGGGATGDPSPSSPDYMAWKLKKLRGH